MEKGVPLDAWVVFRFNWLPGSFFLIRIFKTPGAVTGHFVLQIGRRRKLPLSFPQLLPLV